MNDMLQRWRVALAVFLGIVVLRVLSGAVFDKVAGVITPIEVALFYSTLLAFVATPWTFVGDRPARQILGAVTTLGIMEAVFIALLTLARRDNMWAGAPGWVLGFLLDASVIAVAVLGARGLVLGRAGPSRT